MRIVQFKNMEQISTIVHTVIIVFAFKNKNKKKKRLET